jgi:ADP-ribosylglycohydrolase
MDALYRERFPEAAAYAGQIRNAVNRAKESDEDHQQVMESFVCDTAAQCLLGAVYASLVCPEDFDSAMILAVNHSGRSAAVAAVTGAILGAKLGAQVLPDFYLDSLEAGTSLRELGADLAKGTPALGLFDDDWDQKYTHGLPL